MRSPLLALVLLAASGPAALACGGPPVCTVKDPTGSPLNVRKAAGGPILTALKNGQKVEVVDHVEVKGQKWARVARFEPDASEPGWVLKAYVRCSGATPASGDLPTCVVRDPTGTPLNMRSQPNGEIYGKIRNGQRVRVHEETMRDGKAWVMAERVADDNAIGFVFDAYLKCEEDGGH